MVKGSGWALGVPELRPILWHVEAGREGSKECRPGSSVNISLWGVSLFLRFPSNLLFTSASGELWKMVRIGGQPLGFGEPMGFNTEGWGLALPGASMRQDTRILWGQSASLYPLVQMGRLRLREPEVPTVYVPDRRYRPPEDERSSFSQSTHFPTLEK